jgi:hypothetical protein
MPSNASLADGFLSLLRTFNFCISEEGRKFRYNFTENTLPIQIGIFNILEEKNIIAPNQIAKFFIKEGLYLPPHFSLLVPIEKTMEIKLLSKQEGSLPLCSPFLSVRPYITLLNNFGINVIFKVFSQSPQLSIDFTNKNLDLLGQFLNVTVTQNKLLNWLFDLPLSYYYFQQNLKENINNEKWNMLSYYYYYKINQKIRDKPTEEKFNVFIKMNNEPIIILPQQKELFINTIFYENLFEEESILSIGANLFPITSKGLIISGICMYSSVNVYEILSPPYIKNGAFHLLKPSTAQKVRVNLYSFGKEITLDNFQQLNTSKVNLHLVDETELPIIDMIEEIVFHNTQVEKSFTLY